MTPHQRYRVEDGQHCVDVQISNIEQLFDNRDPAPFRDRDLDPDLVDYLMAAGEDLVSHGPFRVVFWLGSAQDTHAIGEAYRAHFAYELDRLARRSRRQRRVGQVALAIGVTLLVAFLLLAKLARRIPTLGEEIGEGLAIVAWVVLWRPVEALLYDWLPVRRERVVMEHLLSARVDVRSGRKSASHDVLVAPI